MFVIIAITKIGSLYPAKTIYSATQSSIILLFVNHGFKQRRIIFKRLLCGRFVAPTIRIDRRINCGLHLEFKSISE